MTGLVDWASHHARMIVAFVVLSIAAGSISYIGLPKEGEPDIDIPALFVSVPFPGISAEDSEKLIVKPLESKLRDLDGLKQISSTAAEGYAIAIMEFEFGWDKQATIAEVRDRVNKAEAEWPDGAEQYSIDEINFSEFPILVISLSGGIPERTLLQVAKDLQSDVETVGAVLEASLAGHRDEMLEVLIDPLQLEAYNVTASELINVVVNNNQLVAAGEIESGSGTYAVKIPSSFTEPQDVYNLPVKVNGDRVITLGQLADIRLTFEDQQGTARFNGESTVALQVVKRKGSNLIDTVAEVKTVVEAAMTDWPPELKDSIHVNYSMDQSKNVESMVSQLEASVLTAIALVMIVVLSALGMRSALLVGFAIPTSFLLCFAILAVAGMSITNIVMFGLILAVGMLVDGAIVVVEYADKRITAGDGPMHAYTTAAKRMFWPIVSSTATTLCAFLPMLFWPGVPGEFMGNLPVTLIFVLSASLVVALIYLPVVGGVAGRLSRFLENRARALNNEWHWTMRLALLIAAAVAMFAGIMMVLRGIAVPGAVVFVLSCLVLSVAATSFKSQKLPPVGHAGYKRSPFGHFINTIAGNWLMPFVTIGLVIFFVMQVFSYFGENSKGVEFFVETEPEQAIVFVRARGNLSLSEKDRLVRSVEDRLLSIEGIESVFSFAGAGGINQNTGGAQAPTDTIGQIQLELAPWEERRKGALIIEDIGAAIEDIPGIKAEILEASQGPADGKPINVRLTGTDWDDLLIAADDVNSYLQTLPNLVDIEDSRPLPGIDWQIDVDVEQAGRYGASVATVGAMVQLVTRGILLDTMQVDTSDEEIEIRVRYPEQDRVMSTLDEMRVRTPDGLIPLSNFITRKPVPKLAEINRFESERQFSVRAGVGDGINAQSEVDKVTAGLELRQLLPNDLTQDDVISFVSSAQSDPEARAYAALERWLTVNGVWAGEEINFPRTASDLEAIPSDDATVVSGAELAQSSEHADDIAGLIQTELASQLPHLPETVAWEMAGDQEEQAESQAFLGQAFLGALGLMFVILLAQFNSFYNSVVVLLAVILSVTGVLIGMLVMDQTFSIIMTGTGVVALAGIVVNNNIVLIDTYQEYAKYMPRIEAITRTAEARIRPVLLTTITTMAGLTPMMFGISVDFFGGGYTVDAPTALWWKQLATAVVFGLGLATILTLVVTPALLAIRVWVTKAIGALALRYERVRFGAESQGWLDRQIQKVARKIKAEDIAWVQLPASPVAAATAGAAAPGPARDRQSEQPTAAE